MKAVVTVVYFSVGCLEKEDKRCTFWTVWSGQTELIAQGYSLDYEARQVQFLPLRQFGEWRKQTFERIVFE